MQTNKDSVQVTDNENPVAFLKQTSPLNDYMVVSNNINTANGWNDDWNLIEKLLLVHTEISEAVEELRKHNVPRDTYYSHTDEEIPKIEGFASEIVDTLIADTLIRIFDICYVEDIPIEKILKEKLAYNATRGYRHGNKKY